jgi:hypothetical protein
VRTSFEVVSAGSFTRGSMAPILIAYAAMVCACQPAPLYMSLAHDMSGLGSTPVVRFSVLARRPGDELDSVATGLRGSSKRSPDGAQRNSGLVTTVLSAETPDRCSTRSQRVGAFRKDFPRFHPPLPRLAYTPPIPSPEGALSGPPGPRGEGTVPAPVGARIGDVSARGSPSAAGARA